MHTVRQWLEELGLPQQAKVFAENDVDLEALRFLTEGNLEKLSISLGNRKKLLNAISQFEGSRPPAAAASDKSPHQRIPSHQRHRPVQKNLHLGQRMQLFVVHVDHHAPHHDRR